MPKLWNETVEAHRHAVRDAIMETTAALAVEHGIAAVKMSQIAEQAGIGRATLYKYFPDVESILIARHQRHVEEHLAQLAQLRDRAGTPAERLEAVLGAYALICHHRARHGGEISALVHRGKPMDQAEQRLVDLFRDLLADVAATGGLREDTSPEELATYCMHALSAAGHLPDETAVNRLVTVTLGGLRPSPATIPAAGAQHHGRRRGGHGAH
ncbi:TetR/AcrR family transcriptional regulator [Streptacidiphilus fuscans]|uniref:TetR/AcrR family transcriptional regulator n=1 Tax=Streptacidiphilus fuscans TaxID=2789292 RepID=A0A931AVX3_9ACTN|nr:TetR/AcrR family transcriptional regulator [Streptacidiphilus fuscans]MBF9066445.1 TetR/AcrR family transcriptional regulator [Streptacidiphilus fuscans]